MENVNIALKKQLFIKINAIAKKDFIGMNKNGHVYLNVDNGKNGTVKNAFVKMVVDGMEINVKNVQ